MEQPRIDRDVPMFDGETYIFPPLQESTLEDTPTE